MKFLPHTDTNWSRPKRMSIHDKLGNVDSLSIEK